MTPFTPPFCPHRGCSEHFIHRAQPYQAVVPWGFYETKAFGRIPRFRCTRCGRTFSVQTFRLDYYAKRAVGYDDLALRLSSCESLRAIGRAIGLSCDSVSNRVSRASRQALAAESTLSSCRTPSEDLSADGFESYCVSKYFPNNIHLLVGQRSQFVYATNHVTLRRKGRMTERQRERRKELDKRFRPTARGIELAFSRIGTEALRVLSDSRRRGLALWTDEKVEYRRALESRPCIEALEKAGRFRHRTISSRAARTRDNPLFAVNYLDRELRKDLHEHVRETGCFGRNVNHQMERLTLYLFGHNYRKPFRIPWDNRTHAEVAGYDVAAIGEVMEWIWRDRAFLSLTELTEDMKRGWLREYRTPLKEGKQYVPGYAAA
jgi:transposase-like protein